MIVLDDDLGCNACIVLCRQITNRLYLNMVFTAVVAVHSIWAYINTMLMYESYSGDFGFISSNKYVDKAINILANASFLTFMEQFLRYNIISPQLVHAYVS